VNIGAEEVFEIPGATVFVEWPEMLEGRFEPTVRIRIEKTEADEMRRFEIERLSEPRIFS
jgi:tRNA A37 threonylcarbamoyladenosine biosynthesis protein TsaE